jgi:hypothetical protein
VTGKHTSPLVRFLHDPPRELARALSLVEHHAAHLLPFAIALCACAAALLVTRLLLARIRERRLADGARLLQLAVPPELDLEGALLLWLALHDLLRPRLARLFGGQPQLAWEIAADNAGSRFRLWSPRRSPTRPGRTRARLRLARHHHQPARAIRNERHSRRQRTERRGGLNGRRRHQ